nr:hypothetical protein [Tanacetum cinerariifolium]
IEPQFKNIIENGPFIPMTAVQRKPEGIWTSDERKAANLDQQLKSIIMSNFQDSPDDEEDTRSSQEYMDDLEEEYQERAFLAKSKMFFKKGTQRPTKDFEAKYNKVKAKMALISSSALASKASIVKNKEEMSSDDNVMVEVKVLMALAEDNDAVKKEGARNGE